MTFDVVDKTTGKEVTESTISTIAKQARNKGLFKTMDVGQFYVGEDGQLVLADKCGNIAGVRMDFFEAVLENNEPDEADRIVSKMGEVKVGGSIGITREMLEGVSAEDRKILSEIEHEMECTMESDPRTMSDPYHEYGWLFSKINGWRKKLREMLDRD